MLNEQKLRRILREELTRVLSEERVRAARPEPNWALAGGHPRPGDGATYVIHSRRIPGEVGSHQNFVLGQRFRVVEVPDLAEDLGYARLSCGDHVVFRSVENIRTLKKSVDWINIEHAILEER